MGRAVRHVTFPERGSSSRLSQRRRISPPRKALIINEYNRINIIAAPARMRAGIKTIAKPIRIAPKANRSATDALGKSRQSACTGGDPGASDGTRNDRRFDTRAGRKRRTRCNESIFPPVLLAAQSLYLQINTWRFMTGARYEIRGMDRHERASARQRPVNADRPGVRGSIRPCPMLRWVEKLSGDSNAALQCLSRVSWKIIEHGPTRRPGRVERQRFRAAG